MNQPTVLIEDDYGQRAALNTAQIHGYAIEDLDMKWDANNEISAAQLRGQIRLDAKLNSDPDPSVVAAIRNAKQRNIIQRGAMPGPMPPM